MGEVKYRVTMHESEEDGFRSEFHRNSKPKGFKDTKWKRHYPEVVRTKLSMQLSYRLTRDLTYTICDNSIIKVRPTLSRISPPNHLHRIP